MFNYIYHNFQEDLKIQAVGRQIWRDGGGLNRILLFQAERNFEDFLNYLRVNKACELDALHQNEHHRYRHRVGYNTVKTFSRNFVKLKSMTPATFRKHIILQHGGESIPKGSLPYDAAPCPLRAGAPPRGGFLFGEGKKHQGYCPHGRCFHGHRLA